jgi:flagellar biosynthesis/type III secretory pathway protein FliH
MTNEEIARLIVDAYNAGKTDGQSIGYEIGYGEGYGEGYSYSEDDGCQKAFDNGYEKGYEAAREEFEVVVEVDEDEEEMSSAQWYDAGWNDGYEGKDPDEEMKEDPVYMWGYKDGRGQRIAAMEG